MSNDKKKSGSTTQDNNKKSHAEIRKARGEKNIDGSTKIQLRLQRRIERLVNKGGIASQVLVPGLTSYELSVVMTKAEVIKAETAFEKLMAKYERF